MPADLEIPVPAASAGLIDRLFAHFKAKEEAPEVIPEPSALETELAIIKAERDSLIEAGTQAADKLDSLTAELATVQGDLDSNCEILNAINMAIPGITAAANITEHITAHVQAATAEAIAAAGFKANEAPANDPKAGEEAPSMPKAEFDALSFEDRNKHIRAGGKVTE